jgi:hypothetical protein
MASQKQTITVSHQIKSGEASMWIVAKSIKMLTL